MNLRMTWAFILARAAIDIRFRITSGAIVSANSMAGASSPVGLADPAADRGLCQVEPAHLLRKQIDYDESVLQALLTKHQSDD